MIPKVVQSARSHPFPFLPRRPSKFFHTFPPSLLSEQGNPGSLTSRVVVAMRHDSAVQGYWLLFLGQYAKVRD